MTIPPAFGPGPQPIADAEPRNWVDRRAPAVLAPYLKLARLDRPIGIWLLLFPCWWATAMAVPFERTPLVLGTGALAVRLPDPLVLGLFALGAIVMRGAGCTYNDILDRNLDAAVARTRRRPLPSGAVSVSDALAFLALQGLAGLAILVAFNRATILLGLAALLPVAIYPLMKRVTYWPQLFLGIAFNWGALLGWTAVTGALGWPALFLYLGGILWTLGYDTIYAHQDKEDDLLIGIGSTALKFGERSKPWIAGFYGAAIACFWTAGWMAGLGPAFYVGLGGLAMHFAWQVGRIDLDAPSSCLRAFRSNKWAGWILFGGIALGVA